MNAALGHWLLPQIERLARTQPGKVEALLDAVRHSLPEFHSELVMMALEHGDLDESQAAAALETDPVSLALRLEAYRKAVAEGASMDSVEIDANGVARIEGKHVTVWEVVREYRRTGSVSAMRGAFPGLSEAELRSALHYAGRNPDEIGAQIRAYEEIIARSRAAYPFAK